ncbi:MAG: hypothetical protein KatS3mg102_2617 [Planctomycetota bacterium]|nr:MAG: hypothetical protein KatS3mg102_2617 [Planctomycetota bacterium]
MGQPDASLGSAAGAAGTASEGGREALARQWRGRPGRARVEGWRSGGTGPGGPTGQLNNGVPGASKYK